MKDDTNSVPSTDEDISLEEESEDTPSLPTQKLARLEEALKKCKEERDEYLSGWQRAKADFVNSRKETQSGLKGLEKEITAKLLGDFLPVLDTFSIAKSNKEAWEKVDANWRQGVEHIEKMLTETLASHGLETFGEVGEEFSPEKYHALASVPVSESEDHTVVEVIKPGYRMNGQIIRPAEVKVGEFRSEKPQGADEK
jgi:molecular chaperone GrpE